MKKRRSKFTDGNQNLEEESRILSNEIEQLHNPRQVENNNEERQILAKNSRRLFDEIEELNNLINS